MPGRHTCCQWHSCKALISLSALQGPDCQLKVRLLLHCAAKLCGPQADLAPLLGGLGANVDDQVSLAALHYGRNDYRRAADIYEGLLDAHPDLHAVRQRLLIFCSLDGGPQHRIVQLLARRIVQNNMVKLVVHALGGREWATNAEVTGTI